MKRIFVVALLLISLLSSCTRQDEKIVFEGKISNHKKGKIYLSHFNPDETVVIDSATIHKGTFKIVLKNKKLTQEPTYYILSLTPENNIRTIARGGEHLIINADASSLVKSYTIQGGEDAVLMWELDQKLKQFIDTVDQLVAFHTVNITNDSARMYVETIYMELVDQHTTYLESFIEKNKHSLASLSAFYQIYSRRRFLDEYENLPILKEIHTELQNRYPNNENVQYIARRIEKLEIQNADK